MLAVFQANSGKVIITTTVGACLSFGRMYSPQMWTASVTAPKTCAQFPLEFHLAVFEDSPVDFFVDSFCRVSNKPLCLLGGLYGSCFCNHIGQSLLRIVRFYMCFKLLGSHFDFIQAKHKLSLRSSSLSSPQLRRLPACRTFTSHSWMDSWGLWEDVRNLNRSVKSDMPVVSV